MTICLDFFSISVIIVMQYFERNVSLDVTHMKYIRKIRNGLFGFSLLIIALGIFLMVEPEFSANIICYIFGGLIFACGVIDIVNYSVNKAQRDYFRFDMIKGITLCSLGLIIVIRPDFFNAILPTIFGLVIAFDGIAKILSSFDIRKGSGKGWIPIMLFGFITTILGFVIIINPFTVVNISMVIIGATLICDGISNIWCHVLLKKKMKECGDYVDTDANEVK